MPQAGVLPKAGIPDLGTGLKPGGAPLAARLAPGGFVPEAGEVRSTDRDFTVEWRAGVPSLSFSAEGFRGQKIEMSFGTGYAFREDDLRFGKVYDYRFQTRELKSPLQEVAAIHGWTWRPVAFGRL